jgi:hypothetical protein
MICNNPNYWGNANQNHNEILKHIYHDSHYQKRKNDKCYKDAEKVEYLCAVGGNVTWYSH